MKKWLTTALAATLLASVVTIVPTTAVPTTTVEAAGVQNTTIIVKAGEVYDGKGARFIAGSALGDGSQKKVKNLFSVLKMGALKNVVLGYPAADGVHTYGNATLENIVWEDIGEDAMTIKEGGTVTLKGGSATNGDDKMFKSILLLRLK